MKIDFLEQKTLGLFKVFLSVKEKKLKDKLNCYLKYFLGSKYESLDYNFPQILKDCKNLDDLLNFLQHVNEFKYSLINFDCVTLVETVISLLNINDDLDFDEFNNNFKQNLMNIRYKKGLSTFLNRNHFMSCDWLPNNSKYINECSHKLNLPINIAKTYIDKPSWLLKQQWLKEKILNLTYLDEKNIYNNLSNLIHPDSGFNPDNENKFTEANLSYYKNLDYIRSNLVDFKPVFIETNYIKISCLLQNYDKLLKQLPESTVAIIVRENWDLKEKIGTCLNISHLGFCIKEAAENKIIFYHATSELPKEVVAVDFYKYLNFCLDIDSISGINFFELRAQ